MRLARSKIAYPRLFGLCLLVLLRLRSRLGPKLRVRGADTLKVAMGAAQLLKDRVAAVVLSARLVSMPLVGRPVKS